MIRRGKTVRSIEELMDFWLGQRLLKLPVFIFHSSLRMQSIRFPLSGTLIAIQKTTIFIMWRQLRCIFGKFLHPLHTSLVISYLSFIRILWFAIFGSFLRRWVDHFFELIGITNIINVSMFIWNDRIVWWKTPFPIDYEFILMYSSWKLLSYDKGTIVTENYSPCFSKPIVSFHLKNEPVKRTILPP